MTWLRKIVPSLGLLIGIIFVAIGATMTLSSVFKLVFNVGEQYPPVYNCDMAAPVIDGLERKVESGDLEPTAEDIAECEAKYEQKEKDRILTKRLDSILDGSAFLIVGIFFWMFFWKRQDS
jgi:hypothetical protein